MNDIEKGFAYCCIEKVASYCILEIFYRSPHSPDPLVQEELKELIEQVVNANKKYEEGK